MKPSLSGSTADFIEHNGGLPTEFLKQHPFYDDFWREKTAKLDQITIPMLVCASFSDQGFHTVGSFRAFVKSKSSQKWVYTHRTGKWFAYYSPEVQQLIKEFMDCFLKDDTSSGFRTAPPCGWKFAQAAMSSTRYATSRSGRLDGPSTPNST